MKNYSVKDLVQYESISNNAKVIIINNLTNKKALFERTGAQITKFKYDGIL